MIYFMQAADGGPVKIGFTDNLTVRHRQLQAHYGRPLEVLATIPGDRADEAEIHARFAHLRLDRTEQFRPTPELAAFIEIAALKDGRLSFCPLPLLVAANPDVVQVMEPDRVAVVVLKDSLEYREWLNGISRETLIPVASIVRDALAKWATQRGYPAPPERRP